MNPPALNHNKRKLFGTGGAGGGWRRWMDQGGFESDVSDFLVSGAPFAFFFFFFLFAKATWSRAETGAVQELM